MVIFWKNPAITRHTVFKVFIKQPGSRRLQPIRITLLINNFGGWIVVHITYLLNMWYILLTKGGKSPLGKDSEARRDTPGL